MSSTNGAGKAVDGGFRPQAVVNVQPPRQGDLQPKYAQVLQGEDDGSHGWYGSMSACRLAARSPAALLLTRLR
jgi:hypothetical protein